MEEPEDVGAGKVLCGGAFLHEQDELFEGVGEQGSHGFRVTPIQRLKESMKGCCQTDHSNHYRGEANDDGVALGLEFEIEGFA